MTIMIDGVSADVGAIRAWMSTHGEHPVAGYVTGGLGVEWSESQFGLFTRKIRISQQPSELFDKPLSSRVLDIETGAATAADAPEFILARQAAGHDDATIYCDISHLADVISHCDAASVRVPRWWIAWWWQRPGYPTVAQVQDEIQRLMGNTLPADRIWACQYINMGFADKSIVYGTPDFAR